MERGKKENLETLNMIASVIWSIWTARNYIYFWEKKPELVATSQRATLLGYDYRTASQSGKKQSIPSRNWFPPPVGYLKVNTDAARIGSGKWGTGVVGRNWKGDLVLAGAKYVSSMEDPVVAECLALRWAMDLIGASDYTRIMLETDCLRACGEFRNPNPQSQIHDLLEDIRAFADGFEEFSLSFAPRICNMVAHVMAKNFSKDEPVLWMNDFPENIALIANNDISHCDLSAY